MKLKQTFLGFALMSLTAVASVQAMSMNIFEGSGYLYSSSLYDWSVQDQQFPSLGLGEFEDAGLSVEFTHNLDSDNLGTFSWQVINETGLDLLDTWFFGFLDVEFGDYFWDEFGDHSALELGTGMSDNLPDTWEIDYGWSDMFDNLLMGTLDNQNPDPGSWGDDVYLALGFELGTFGQGETLAATFNISPTNNGGLYAFDPYDTGEGIYFGGNAHVTPEPATIVFLATGLIGLGLVAHRRKRNGSGNPAAF